jgi:hypothetical protein
VTGWLAELGIGAEPSDEQNGGSGDVVGNSNGGSGSNEGTVAADGRGTGVGAEMRSWLGKLGAVGIPGFLLIVLLLWLWERWTRAEER